MDTITHTLFGLALYESLDKSNMSKQVKRTFLFTAIGASQIPDIDVISQAWDTEGLYQMWHRGITHSIFLTPLWALLFYLIVTYLLRLRDKRIFFLSWIAVIIHDTSDLFNAWGTGYLEPFLDIRITFGTIPIIDFTVWFILLVAYILKKKSTYSSYKVFRIAWIAIALHVILQSAQGYYLYEHNRNHYDQVALSANFIPTQFTIIGKKDDKVDIINDSLFTSKQKQYSLQSAETANLDHLFKEVPEAKTLYQWAPFVVVVDDEQYLGVYDPRFYRNGQSFLYEFIEKKSLD